MTNQSDALVHHFPNSDRIKEAKQKFHKQIRNIRINSGNERAFGTEPDVLEGALFGKYSYGTGSYLQKRQVKLSQTEYYGGVMSLADGDFGSDTFFISLAHDASRFEKASHATFRLTGEAASRLATTCPADIVQAIRRSTTWKPKLIIA